MKFCPGRIVREVDAQAAGNASSAASLPILGLKYVFFLEFSLPCGDTHGLGGGRFRCCWFALCAFCLNALTPCLNLLHSARASERILTSSSESIPLQSKSCTALIMSEATCGPNAASKRLSQSSCTGQRSKMSGPSTLIPLSSIPPLSSMVRVECSRVKIEARGATNACRSLILRGAQAAGNQEAGFSRQSVRLWIVESLAGNAVEGGQTKSQAESRAGHACTSGEQENKADQRQTKSCR